MPCKYAIKIRFSLEIKIIFVPLQQIYSRGDGKKHLTELLII